MIDTATEFGMRVTHRLSEERIIWLTTVRRDRTPQPSPVWFLWDGETFLIYSQLNTPKLRNIRHSSKVSLHLHGDFYGSDIVIFSGEAWIENDAPPSTGVPALMKKYEPNFDQTGDMTAEGFARDYPVAIRVKPTGLRGF